MKEHRREPIFCNRKRGKKREIDHKENKVTFRGERPIHINLLVCGKVVATT